MAGSTDTSGELAAFSLEQTSRLTGLSERQLRYWDTTGFFSPEYADENRHRPFSRIYSYRDVVGLRALSLLRNQHGVPLQELRRVREWIEQHHETPWAELTFYIAGKRVFFDVPSAEARGAGRPTTQTVMPIEMAKIARETDRAVAELRRRRREDIGRIVRNRHIQHNDWVLAGTRIPTWSVWELHQAGYNTDAILHQFPSLTPQDVQAAIAHEATLNSQARVG